MTVKENISYGLKLRKISASEMQARMDEVISLTQLDGYRDRLPGQLSGGQQQRVALARALAIKPNILFLDEPLSNLDARLRLEMRDAICDIHRKTNITMIYVTHDQREALSMGSEVSVMRKGKLVQTSSPRVLYHKPKTPFIAQFIGQTNLIEGTVTEKDATSIVVKTNMGLLRGTSFQPEQAVGDKVFVSIRPESFSEAIPSDSKSNPVNGYHLDDTSFLGEAQMLYLKNNEGHSLKVKLFHSQKLDWRKGEVLNLNIGYDDVVVLPFANADELSQAT
jgi:ABC-type Fe3+/spermidine/putrescine transport system ATPase subunit